MSPTASQQLHFFRVPSQPATAALPQTRGVPVRLCPRRYCDRRVVGRSNMAVLQPKLRKGR
jgi:hypothetical protein